MGRIDTGSLPLCQLGFPERTEAESGNLSVFEEAPLFSGGAVLTLKSLTLGLAAIVLSVVLITSLCIGACWLAERRQVINTC